MKKALVAMLVVAQLAISGEAIRENVFSYGSAGTSQGWFVTIPYTDHWCGHDDTEGGWFCDND